MIPASFEYERVESVEEAVELLGRDEDAKLLSGGHSLIPAMKLRIARPALLVDVGGLGLDAIAVNGGELHVGALATWDDLARSPALGRPALGAIAECAAGIGDLQVRNRGTLGGGLVHADPASDMPAVVLALGAGLIARSPEGERAIAADEFFLGPFTTALAQGELLMEIVAPLPPPRSGSAYVSIEHPASGFALAGAAALVLPDGTRRVAVTGLAGRPALLPGGEPTDELEAFGDRFAPAEYRRHLAAVVARRALERAAARAEEDASWTA